MSAATFLIVEDSPTMRQLLAFSLRRLKECRIIEAVDGVDALKKLTTERVDLVITDINMPMMDGLKLISLIRGNPRTKTLPIIIVTTEGAEEDRKRGLALGANAYIPKPIQPSDLLRTIASLLESSRN
ncbi:MAG TPA: response regulator [Candidatus Polarisedimenticolia bacterium]|jgi:two-component system chemotaxis response regulator CheY|nr:response regulator [Candidatus Polarisedimenticolia bacterium]